VRYGINPDELKTWLFLFALWLWDHVGSEFEQKFYTFGIVLLRNLAIPAAMQAFANLICPIAPRYLRRDFALLSFLPRIMEKRDPEYAKLQFVVWSFARVSSLFSQLTPLTAVEEIWDFFILYGVHFVVYVEVAFLEINKPLIIERNVPPADPRYLVVDDSRALLTRAVDIYNQVDDQLDQEIRECLYGNGKTPELGK
jgi:hypothetical protein